jgi:NTP pyrophosphatase (non-canonical NTP hydrolase)
MNNDSISQLMNLIREFDSARNWKRFHTARNLITALAIEVSEMLEPFQWDINATEKELINERKQYLTNEIADIAMYLIRIADVLEVNIGEAVENKMEEIIARWPADSTAKNEKPPGKLLTNKMVREPSKELFPAESWDNTHPDHDYWYENTGKCFAIGCENH